MDELWVCHLGLTPYAEAARLQERLRAARQAELLPDVMLMLEHPPVYTRGRRSAGGELPLGEAWYRERGIDVVDTNRGGKLTYHGPGQLVGYPIMRTGDVIVYLRTMERAIIAALAEEGIRAGVREGLTGVWVEDRKIASIGVHISRGVTTHGFAVNVENDLEPFAWVVPCGIDGVRMTSVGCETARTRALPCFRKRMAHQFARAHALRQRLVSPARLESIVSPALAGHLAADRD
ncbi:MAG TPA: lipoyl(octanoyl) transferase LipB [Solirubrobacteraceae bacterium]|nr:lipoyl(octanoyl) transferase LipB [Solirubrobacteraceae bacterium]